MRVLPSGFSSSGSSVQYAVSVESGVDVVVVVVVVVPVPAVVVVVVPVVVVSLTASHSPESVIINANC